MGLPRWLSSRESSCNAGKAGDSSSIPGLGRSPGGGNGNLLQYSCLENSMDRGEEPGGLQSIGLQRVGYDWATEHTWNLMAIPGMWGNRFWNVSRQCFKVICDFKVWAYIFLGWTFRFVSAPPIFFGGEGDVALNSRNLPLILWSGVNNLCGCVSLSINWE